MHYFFVVSIWNQFWKGDIVLFNKFTILVNNINKWEQMYFRRRAFILALIQTVQKIYLLIFNMSP